MNRRSFFEQTARGVRGDGLKSADEVNFRDVIGALPIPRDLIAARDLGHAEPSVTLAVYGHMFTTDDRKAADAINAALAVS